MPSINLSFSGWIIGAKVEKATDVKGDQVDVSNMDAAELSRKLKAGELFISLGDYLYNNRKNEIEMFDFEPAEN